MIKTFRGLLLDVGVDRIRLSTKKGKVGYRIKKFEIIAWKPGQLDYEATVTVNKVDFTPMNAIDLSDGNVLAVGYWSADNRLIYPQNQTMVIFEHEIFNQDIFVGNNDLQGGSMNYYLELETFPMSDNAAAVSTLRDIRLNPQVGA
jgi:hypothetical protein